MLEIKIYSKLKLWLQYYILMKDGSLVFKLDYDILTNFLLYVPEMLAGKMYCVQENLKCYET